jgi:UPF0716 family protein affecting phage T7 exclusion
MKMVIVLILLFVTVATASCQQANNSRPLTRAYYFKKSQSQRQTARVLLIGGSALAVTAIAIAAPGNITFETLGTLVTVAAIGGVAALGCIPLFRALKRNKRKARGVSANPSFDNTSYINQAWHSS